MSVAFGHASNTGGHAQHDTGPTFGFAREPTGASVWMRDIAAAGDVVPFT